MTGMKSTPARRKTGTTTGRQLYVILAWCCVMLAGLGVVLPLLPTTPFLLCSLWLSLKGESALADWLVQHPHFGPPIRRWQRERSIALGTKRLVTALLLLNWLVLLVLGVDTQVLLVTALIFCGVLIFIWRLPTDRGRETDRRATTARD